MTAHREGLVRLRRGVVTVVGVARPGAVELTVEVEGAEAPAIAYPDLVGPVAAGDGVVLNTTAVALGLGTGGFHLVVAVERGSDVDLGHEGEPTGIAVRELATGRILARLSNEQLGRLETPGGAGGLFFERKG